MKNSPVSSKQAKNHEELYDGNQITVKPRGNKK
jgi:hypothetical protein